MNKIVLILLPDGVGLRNFAYTNFYKKAQESGLTLIFWNITPFPIHDLGYSEIRVHKPKIHWLTDILKVTVNRIELKINEKNERNIVYNTYLFPLKYRTIRNIFKNVLILILKSLFRNQSGVDRLRRVIKKLERGSKFYRQCLNTLEEYKPDLVFCTNQRSSLALSPIFAAEELNIPTATFIFSWDNLPKATKVIDVGYYFVWSQFMKNELLHYYPNIADSQVVITGTPQFEEHLLRKKVIDRNEFYKLYSLDLNRRYICFSGDDITTSPNDPYYLRDLAECVRGINNRGGELGIVFRRCPVDLSDRYDFVLDEYSDVIVSITPKWKRIGEGWNTVLPYPEDIDLLVNTIAHTEMVVNLGSSMVFDFAVFDKPCAYINYDQEVSGVNTWSVVNLYNYIHFRSMPDKNAVIWINSKEEMATKILNALNGDASETIVQAKKWFQIINMFPADDASFRIVKEMSICCK